MTSSKDTENSSSKKNYLVLVPCNLTIGETDTYNISWKSNTPSLPHGLVYIFFSKHLKFTGMAKIEHGRIFM